MKRKPRVVKKAEQRVKISPTARLVEDIVLRADETLAKFYEALYEAIEEQVQFDEVVKHCWVTELASAWFVLCVVEADENGMEDSDLYRVSYSRDRATGAFTFTAVEEVVAVTTYAVAPDEPEDDEEPGEPEDDGEMESTTTGDVVVAPGARARKRLRMKHDAAPPKPDERKENARRIGEVTERREFVERWGFGLRAVRPDDTVESLVERGASPEWATEMLALRAQLPEAAPNGKPFIGLILGEGAVFGVFNRNSRIYPAGVGRTECERIAKLIEGCYLRKKEGDRDLQISEVDHPPFGARLASSCLMQLRSEYVGDDKVGRARIAFGVMDMTEGRDLMAYAEYGGAIGFSTRSFGRAEYRVMSPDDPNWESNKQHDGAEYEFVFEFTIEATDAVRDPSANVWASEVKPLGEAERREAAILEEVANAIRAAGTTLVEATADGASEAAAEQPPITEATGGTTTAPNDTTEETMNKDDLKKALEATSPEDFAALAPGLFGQIVAAAKAESAAVVADLTAKLEAAGKTQTEQAGKLDAALAKLDAIEKKHAVTEAIALDLKGEADAAKGKLERARLAGAKLEERRKDPAFKFGAALEKYLAVHFVESSVPADKLDDVVKAFERDHALFLNESAGASTSEAAPTGAAQGGDAFLEGVSLN